MKFMYLFVLFVDRNFVNILAKCSIRPSVVSPKSRFGNVVFDEVPGRILPRRPGRRFFLLSGWPYGHIINHACMHANNHANKRRRCNMYHK